MKGKSKRVGYRQSAERSYQAKQLFPRVKMGSSAASRRHPAQDGIHQTVELGGNIPEIRSLLHLI